MNKAKCVECAHEGNLQIVERKLGAWWCPKHWDRCHIVAVDRNDLREQAQSGHRSVEQISTPIQTPKTDAAPPQGDDTPLIMLAGAIKAWWMHKCALCGRFYDENVHCCHTGTKWEDRPACFTLQMWDSPLHQQYVAYRNELTAAIVATNRYAVYLPHNAIKGRWNPPFQKINDMAIETSSLMVVMSPKDIPTDGTDEEVITAAEFGTDVMYAPMTTFSVSGTMFMIDGHFEIQKEIANGR